MLLIENAWFSTTRREALPDSGFFWPFRVLCRTVKTFQLWLWGPAVQDTAGAGAFSLVEKADCSLWPLLWLCPGPTGATLTGLRSRGCSSMSSSWSQIIHPWHGKPCPASQSGVLGWLGMVAAHPLGDQPASGSAWNPWQGSERPVKAAS